MTIREAHKAAWAAHDRAWRSYEAAVRRARAGRGTWLDAERKRDWILATAARADAVARLHSKEV